MGPFVRVHVAIEDEVNAVLVEGGFPDAAEALHFLVMRVVRVVRGAVVHHDEPRGLLSVVRRELFHRPIVLRRPRMKRHVVVHGNHLDHAADNRTVVQVLINIAEVAVQTRHRVAGGIGLEGVVLRVAEGRGRVVDDGTHSIILNIVIADQVQERYSRKHLLPEHRIRIPSILVRGVPRQVIRGVGRVVVGVRIVPDEENDLGIVVEQVVASVGAVESLAHITDYTHTEGVRLFARQCFEPVLVDGSGDRGGIVRG
mmetsp:Transcript_4989/g.9210  ORF Transcript_4989/g.9210 Transcript_4989/m.9210 type:complete len:256 (+) Transcript_4989:795-1562(+)